MYHPSFSSGRWEVGVGGRVVALMIRVGWMRPAYLIERNLQLRGTEGEVSKKQKRERVTRVTRKRPSVKKCGC